MSRYESIDKMLQDIKTLAMHTLPANPDITDEEIIKLIRDNSWGPDGMYDIGIQREEFDSGIKFNISVAFLPTLKDITITIISTKGNKND